MPSQSVTLATVRTLVRQRTDTVNTTFVTDTELNGWINDSASELWDLLVEAYGEDYYTTVSDISTTANQEFITIPTGLYQLKGVYSYITRGSDRIRAPLSRSSLLDMLSDQRTPGWTVSAGYCDASYRIVADRIYVAPLPTAVHTLELWFIPTFPQLTVDGSTFDSYNGWHEYVVCDVAIKVATKDQADPSVFAAQKAAMKERISRLKTERDAGQNNYIQNLAYSGWNSYGIPPEWRRP